MNIFALDYDPKKAAEKTVIPAHIVKMPTETAQILSTAVRLLTPRKKVKPGRWTNLQGKREKYDMILPEERKGGFYIQLYYKATHVNHPSCVWARTSKENFVWLVRYGMALSYIYSRTRGKTILSSGVIEMCERWLRSGYKFPSEGLTPFATAMPDEFKVSEDPVVCYQAYYEYKKKELRYDG